MPDKTWKSVERRICRYLGTERALQEGRKGMPDGVSNMEVTLRGFTIQVKHRKKFPTWLMAALEDTEKHNEGDRIPIVCLHEKQQRIEDTLVITRLKYLKGAE